MKKQYTEPQMEVITVQTQTVLAASGPDADSLLNPGLKTVGMSTPAMQTLFHFGVLDDLLGDDIDLDD